MSSKVCPRKCTVQQKKQVSQEYYPEWAKDEKKNSNEKKLTRKSVISHERYIYKITLFSLLFTR